MNLNYVNLWKCTFHWPFLGYCMSGGISPFFMEEFRIPPEFATSFFIKGWTGQASDSSWWAAGSESAGNSELWVNSCESNDRTTRKQLFSEPKDDVKPCQTDKKKLEVRGDEYHWISLLYPTQSLLFWIPVPGFFFDAGNGPPSHGFVQWKAVPPGLGPWEISYPIISGWKSWCPMDLFKNTKQSNTYT